VKFELTSAQPLLKLIASEGNRLVVIIWARDIEFRCCGHSLSTSLREKNYGSTDFISIWGLHQP
jgi:hypothetical protein